MKTINQSEIIRTQMDEQGLFYTIMVGDLEVIYDGSNVIIHDDSEDHLKGSDLEERIKC